jgi:hypothetical protein
VDLDEPRMIDLVQGNAAADLRRWCANADPVWLARIGVVATDLAESYRAGLSPHLDHATRVADPMLLLLSSPEGSGTGENLVDVACDVALQAPHGFSA